MHESHVIHERDLPLERGVAPPTLKSPDGRVRPRVLVEGVASPPRLVVAGAAEEQRIAVRNGAFPDPVSDVLHALLTT